MEVKVVRRLVVFAVAGLVIAVTLSTACGGGDSSDSSFRVLIPAGTLNAPVNLPERPAVKTLGEATGTLTVFVGSQECVTADLADRTARDAAGDLLIKVGAPGQPTGCAVEGARVTFVEADGKELYVEFVFRRGATEILSNLAPKPPN